jgi:hypothetical protein
MINNATEQLLFVLDVLDHKNNGYYVEIGSGDPIVKNNTYVLETKYNWNGLSIDIDDDIVNDYNSIRKNKSICEDASLIKFDKYFEKFNFPKQIDYLQIDVDFTPQYISLYTLLNIPLSRYRFSILSFEHSNSHGYRNKKNMEISREILDSYDYELVVKDVHEDIWVDPSIIHRHKYIQFMGPTSRNSKYTRRG